MGLKKIMNRLQDNIDMAQKPDREEIEAVLPFLQEELNYRLLCEAFTLSGTYHQTLWVETISLLSYEQAKAKTSKPKMSLWRRIIYFFKKRKRGMEYGNR